MELLIGLVVVGVVLFMMFGGKKTFDDPRPMDNQRLLASIAGQADWLEKMSRSPIESQRSASIVELARKRRGYIAQLCMEVIARADRDDGPKYPGATRSINPFSETAEYAKELEGKGINRDNAAVRAVKDKMFTPNGAIYPTSWEL